MFFISPNAGPAPYTGAQCNPFFFAASWPSEAYSEAAGQYMTSKGLKNVVFLAPNYVGGQDAATGFKRYYKGKLVDEMYTKLGQLDYAAELSQIRAAKPEALYVFLPGGMGINFIKQFVASGMSQRHPARSCRCGAPTRTSSAPSATDARPVQRRPLVDRLR